MGKSRSTDRLGKLQNTYLTKNLGPEHVPMGSLINRQSPLKTYKVSKQALPSLPPTDTTGSKAPEKMVSVSLVIGEMQIKTTGRCCYAHHGVYTLEKKGNVGTDLKKREPSNGSNTAALRITWQRLKKWKVHFLIT